MPENTRWRMMRLHNKLVLGALHPGTNSVTEVWRTTSLELGAILVSYEAIVHSQEMAELIGAWRLNPWAPCVLGHPDPPPLEILAPVLPAGMRFVIVTTHTVPTAAELRQAVAGDVSTHEKALEYLNVRLGTEVSLTVARVLANPTRREELAERGLPTRHVWFSLFEMVRHLSEASAEGWSESGLAIRRNLKVRNISRHCDEYFGTSWPELIALREWEAMLEQGLRHLGVVSGASGYTGGGGGGTPPWAGLIPLPVKPA